MGKYPYSLVPGPILPRGMRGRGRGGAGNEASTVMMSSPSPPPPPWGPRACLRKLNLYCSPSLCHTHLSVQGVELAVPPIEVPVVVFCEDIDPVHLGRRG